MNGTVEFESSVADVAAEEQALQLLEEVITGFQPYDQSIWPLEQ